MVKFTQGRGWLVEAQAAYEEWVRNCKDSELLEELKKLSSDADKLSECFSQELTFGTGGMRGIMGAGPNRMNIYTIRRVTRAFASFLRLQDSCPGVVIGYDSRRNSKRFANEAAITLLGLGVKVWIFSELMPTPILSFAIRALGCSGGIMVTASHNPAAYNGFKAFGRTGTQLKDVDTELISREAGGLDFFAAGEATNGLQAEMVPQAIINNYFETVQKELVLEPIKNLSLVYTPLNGAGNKPVKRILKSMQLCDLWVVPQQEWPDQDFRFCSSPNPEDPKALDLAVELAAGKDADLVIATDPDCDRVGFAEKGSDGYHFFSGNDIGVLLLDYICAYKKKLLCAGASGHFDFRESRLKMEPYVIKSIVTTNMVEAVAKKYGAVVYKTLTGFKNICGKMDDLGREKGGLDGFLLAFEESFGYLPGVYARDKDGVTAAALICEMADRYKTTGRTLLRRLRELYAELGFHMSFATSLVFENLNLMTSIMDDLRRKPPCKLATYDISKIRDYKNGKEWIPKTNKELFVELPVSDVLVFEVVDAQVIIRPSGTEPKLKIYVLVSGATEDAARGKAALLQTALVACCHGPA
ncbi:MAG: phospho-sugar mutase [Oscillospiraceae bacterium]|nr:phospho-sugar mutase [Oscillospiraceae bacterium]